MRARDDGPLHLTGGGKGIGERGLPHPRVAGNDDDTGGAAPHVHPGVVQPAELALPADEELAFEPPWRQLGDGLFSDTGPGRRPPPLPQEVRHAHQVGGGLGGELFGEQGFIPAERLEGVAPVADVRPGLHQAPNTVLTRRVQIEEDLGSSLDGFEIPDAARGVHLANQRVSDLRRQSRVPLVFPLFEGAHAGNLEPLEEPPTHLEVFRPHPMDVDIDGSLDQHDGSPLDHQVVGPDFGLQHGDRLGEGMAGEVRGDLGPQELLQVVAAEALARLDRQPDQQRQMLPGAEADILAGIAAEQRDAKRGKVVVRHGNDWLNRSRMEQ